MYFCRIILWVLVQGKIIHDGTYPNFEYGATLFGSCGLIEPQIKRSLYQWLMSLWPLMLAVGFGVYSLTSAAIKRASWEARETDVLKPRYAIIETSQRYIEVFTYCP